MSDLPVHEDTSLGLPSGRLPCGSEGASWCNGYRNLVLLIGMVEAVDRELGIFWLRTHEGFATVPIVYRRQERYLGLLDWGMDIEPGYAVKVAGRVRPSHQVRGNLCIELIALERPSILDVTGKLPGVLEQGQPLRFKDNNKVYLAGPIVRKETFGQRGEWPAGFHGELVITQGTEDSAMGIVGNQFVYRNAPLGCPIFIEGNVAPVPASVEQSQECVWVKIYRLCLAGPADILSAQADHR